MSFTRAAVEAEYATTIKLKVSIINSYSSSTSGNPGVSTNRKGFQSIQFFVLAKCIRSRRETRQRLAECRSWHLVLHSTCFFFFVPRPSHAGEKARNRHSQLTEASSQPLPEIIDEVLLPPDWRLLRSSAEPRARNTANEKFFRYYIIYAAKIARILIRYCVRRPAKKPLSHSYIPAYLPRTFLFLSCEKLFSSRR